MKKLYLGILFSIQLFAFDTQTASKIFDKIFTAIFTKKPIRVYTVDEEYAEVIRKARPLILEKNRMTADIMLVKEERDIPKKNKKIIFTTNLSVFEKNENAIGAFYWEHGRPKIIFLQSRLQHHDITLAPSFERYIVKELP